MNVDRGSASIALVIHQNRNTAILKHSVNFAKVVETGDTLINGLVTWIKRCKEWRSVLKSRYLENEFSEPPTGDKLFHTYSTQSPV